MLGGKWVKGGRRLSEGVGGEDAGAECLVFSTSGSTRIGLYHTYIGSSKEGLLPQSHADSTHRSERGHSKSASSFQI